MVHRQTWFQRRVTTVCFHFDLHLKCDHFTLAFTIHCLIISQMYSKCCHNEHTYTLYIELRKKKNATK